MENKNLKSIEPSGIELKIQNEYKSKDVKSKTPVKNEEEENFDAIEDHNPNRKPFKKTQFMPIPKKLIFLSVSLLIIGIIFLPIGLNDYLNTPDQKWRGLSFLIFGCLMFVPGLYYTFQIYRACIAGTPEERADILEDIPSVD